jgi:hypothetical protein
MECTQGSNGKVTAQCDPVGAAAAWIEAGEQ